MKYDEMREPSRMSLELEKAFSGSYPIANTLVGSAVSIFCVANGSIIASTVAIGVTALSAANAVFNHVSYNRDIKEAIARENQKTLSPQGPQATP